MEVNTSLCTKEQTTEKSRHVDTVIFTEVSESRHSPLVLVVAIHQLVGSRANERYKAQPSAGAAQPLTRRDPQATSNPIEMLFATLPQGKLKNPLQITLIGAGDNHLPPLDDPRCSKPSRGR